MWLILLVIVIAVSAYVFYVSLDRTEEVALASFGFGATCFVLVILSCIVLALTSGFVPSYSTGSREGYVTKISVKGLIFKTYEGQLQVGTGEMSALQEPWDFSVVDVSVLDKIEDCMGKRSRGAVCRMGYSAV